MKVKVLYFYDAEDEKQFVGIFTDGEKFNNAHQMLKNAGLDDNDIEIEEHTLNHNYWSTL